MPSGAMCLSLRVTLSTQIQTTQIWLWWHGLPGSMLRVPFDYVVGCLMAAVHNSCAFHSGTLKRIILMFPGSCKGLQWLLWPIRGRLTFADRISCRSSKFSYLTNIFWRFVLIMAAISKSIFRGNCENCGHIALKSIANNAKIPKKKKKKKKQTCACICVNLSYMPFSQPHPKDRTLISSVCLSLSTHTHTHIQCSCRFEHDLGFKKVQLWPKTTCVPLLTFLQTVTQLLLFLSL